MFGVIVSPNLDVFFVCFFNSKVGGLFSIQKLHCRFCWFQNGQILWWSGAWITLTNWWCADQHKVLQRSSAAASRARALSAKQGLCKQFWRAMESLREQERARGSQREPERARMSRTASQREPERARESQREPEWARQRAREAGLTS